MIKYLIWLQLSLGQANIRALKALSYFGNAENIYKADETRRLSAKIFSKRDLENLKNTSLSDAVKIIDDCKKNDIRIIAFGDSEYPYCLSVLEDAPLVIYVKGELPDFESGPSICIVGPRKVTDTGKKAAYSLSFRLAAAGFTIVSGGALGCDTYAHAGALKANGKTVLVMGCGICNNYLSENKELRKAVSNSGCLLSEYPPFAPASRFTFPVRNRLLSALSLGTVVVEATSKSGALITANHAIEQGKDVFVIPGPINAKQYEGSNALLRDGAKPILNVGDILGEYIYRFPDKIDVEKAVSSSPIGAKKTTAVEKIEKIEKNLPETLSKEAKIVYNCLDKQKFLPEELSVPDISSGELLSALTELEMEFLIRAIPGGMYEKL